MKKITLNILLIFIIIISLTSCRSTKRGCGLTSDAQEMEQTTITKAKVLAEV